MAERMLMISADGHISGPPETFRPYLESKYHELLPNLEAENELFLSCARIISTFSPETLAYMDLEGAIASGGLSGSWDVDRRIAEMDREGIAAEMLIYGTQMATTPFFGAGNREYPPDVRMAGVRAYHRWLADTMARADGRLFAIADPGPTLDMGDTLAELRWAAAHGFRTVSVPGIVTDPDLPHLTSDYYEPFWQACVELDLPLSVHAAHGSTQGHFLQFIDALVAGSDNPEEILAKAFGEVDVAQIEAPFAHTVVPQRVMWTLMLGGVFDRYPSLQLVLTEVRGDWVPATLELLDRRFAIGDTPLKKRPSEYWSSNCWSAASSIKQSEVRLRNEIGVHRMMFGRDYPHPEGTWPNTWDWLRDALGEVSEAELRGLVGENALRCYKLDEAKLRKIAEHIGPRPEDILGQAHTVDPRVVDHFDKRGGYRKSKEVIDSEAVEEVFNEDLAVVC